MNSDFLSLAGGELRTVNVAELEGELSALWRSAAKDSETEHPVTRSCGLTLLVYVESEEAGQEVLGLIPEVTVRNPCRAVTIVAARSAAPASLAAQISAHCHLASAGEKEVCSEQVRLVARGEAVNGLDQVVIPLMVPELPVVLWWRAGRFSAPPYLDLILRSCDRVLVDSARFSNPEIDVASFYEETRRLPEELVFTDLNWARLTPWRELIAQCFDSAEARPELDRLAEVRIEYEWDSPRVRAHRAQALLLAGWLASRLNWEPESVKTGPATRAAVYKFRSAAGAVRVECAPREFEGGGCGFCFSIALKTQGVPPAEFSLSRGPDGKAAWTRREIPGRPRLERSARLEVLDELQLVNEEIRFVGRDRIYEEALRMVALLAGSAGSSS